MAHADAAPANPGRRSEGGGVEPGDGVTGFQRFTVTDVETPPRGP